MAPPVPYAVSERTVVDLEQEKSPGFPVEVLPVSPWGSFTPALNAIVARASRPVGEEEAELPAYFLGTILA